MENIRRSVAKLMADEKYHIGSVSRHQSAVLGAMKEIGRHATPSNEIWVHVQTVT
jgi:hypothetical protein